MTDFTQLDHRFRNDPNFYAIVNLLMHTMESMALTPFEMREAAMYAAVKFHMIHGSPAVFHGDSKP